MSAEAQVLYSLLLAAPEGIDSDDRAYGDTAALELIQSGLASRVRIACDEPSRSQRFLLTAATPQEPIARLLLAEERKLNELQERMLDVRGELARLRRTFKESRDGRRPVGFVDVLTGAEAVLAARDALELEARKEVSRCGDFVRTNPTSTAEATGARSLRVRALVDHDHFRAGALTEVIGAVAEDGVDVRLVSKLPLTFLVADHAHALIGVAGGYERALLIRSEPFATLLRLYFEILWDRADSVNGKVSSVTERYDAIPQFLAAGLSDDDIARQLGLSVRSVRRRIAAMMDDLGAVSRFQAGVLAERAQSAGRTRVLQLPSPRATNSIQLSDDQCSKV